MKSSLGGERPVLFWSLVIFIVAISFLSLGQRDRMRRMGYAIQAMQKQKTERMKLHKELLIQVEHLNALDRIEQFVTTELSMVPASSEERILVQSPSRKK